MEQRVEEILDRLKSLGDSKVRERNAKAGAGENQFGLRMGDIRKLAKELKTDHNLGLALWQTGNLDARYLAILLMKPKELSSTQVEELMAQADFTGVADWFISYVIKKHPDREALRQKWMEDDNPWRARAGWSLTAARVEKEPQGLDIPGLLDRIEAEMNEAPEQVRWTMNFCLAGIGINLEEYRQRTLSIGESLGAYRDYPVPKGCTSPFAPEWIREMVGRRG